MIMRSEKIVFIVKGLILLKGFLKNKYTPNTNKYTPNTKNYLPCLVMGGRLVLGGRDYIRIRRKGLYSYYIYHIYIYSFLFGSIWAVFLCFQTHPCQYHHIRCLLVKSLCSKVKVTYIISHYIP